MPKTRRKMLLEAFEQLIGKPHERTGFEFHPCLAERRLSNALDHRPACHDLEEFIQFILNIAFAQVQQKGHQLRKRKGSAAGEIRFVHAGFSRELLGTQKLPYGRIDKFISDLYAYALCSWDGCSWD